MKRKVLIGALMITMLSLAGCNDEIFEETGSGVSSESIEETAPDKQEDDTDEQEADADKQEDDTDEQDASDNAQTDDNDSGTSDFDPTKDFMADYTADIEKEVEAAISSASSIQDEFDKVVKIADKYDEYAQEAIGQADMNMASEWGVIVYDYELNSLWGRIDKSADAATKERLLSAQRNWNSMKEDVIISEIGPREESGTIYPLSYNNCMGSLTYNRDVILASELAKIKGESFTMPERALYNTYVDTQGTSEIYSTMVITQSMEGDDIVKLALYREKDIEGSFTKKGNGELEFTDDTGSIKGIIKYGWDGATFEVTQGDDIIATGEKHVFDMAF